MSKLSGEKQAITSGCVELDGYGRRAGAVVAAPAGSRRLATISDVRIAVKARFTLGTVVAVHGAGDVTVRASRTARHDVFRYSHLAVITGRAALARYAICRSRLNGSTVADVASVALSARYEQAGRVAVVARIAGGALVDGLEHCNHKRASS